MSLNGITFIDGAIVNTDYPDTWYSRLTEYRNSQNTERQRIPHLAEARVL